MENYENWKSVDLRKGCAKKIVKVTHDFSCKSDIVKRLKVLKEKCSVIC